MSTWSHSRIECFRQCPRKYWFKYVERVKLPEEPQTVEAFLGGLVHGSLEWAYREVLDARPPSLEALLADYARRWDAEWSDAVVIVAADRTAADYRRVGETCLRDYHARHAPFDAERTMAVEQMVRFPLDASRGIHMMGYVDRIARAADGTWRVHDYKTNQRLPTQAEKDRDPQLAYYQIGLRTLWPDAERVELVWHFLRFDQSIASRRTDAQLVEAREAALVTITDAESRGREAARHETRESRLCDWCDYAALCPARKHPAKVAELSPNEFRGEPGVALVDHWTKLDDDRRALREQQDAIEAEIERVKEALIELAGREGLEVVAGTDREASVAIGERTLFPRKTVEPERAEAFEAALRASRWWPAVSAVDRYALARLLDGRGTDAALRALLEEFAFTEPERSARLRKRRT